MATAASSHVALLQSLFPELPADVATQVMAMCKGNVEAAGSMLEQMMSSSSANTSQAKPAAPSLPPLPDGSARSGTQLYGSHKSTCGYCHSPAKGRTSYGMVCETLNALDYQRLIDLGWRRSGDYLYKQDNVVSCCCNYTIRLDVRKYTRSKAQRSAMNRLERFLRGETLGAEDDGKQQASERMEDVQAEKPPADPHAERIQQALQAAIDALVATGQLPATLTSDTFSKQLRVYAFIEPASKGKGKQENSAAASAAPASAHPAFQYSSNVALVLSGLLRKQKQDVPAVRVAQLISQQLSAHPSPSADGAAPIQSFVAEPLGYLNFHIAGAEAPSSRKRSVSQDHSTKKAPFAKKAAVTAASSQPAAAAAATSSSAAAASVVHRLEVKQVSATFDPRAFAVYRKYQQTVHGDKLSKLTREQYENFLCNSPLILSGPYGGFHHHYLLDGELIAVGVVDVLPSCLSSVYLFYDPKWEHLQLGTVTAVKEIEWVQTQLMPKYPEIKFYYMGYYIHSCPKMLYKGKFAPSDLLCPLRYTWHSLASVLPALDSFAATSGAKAGNVNRCVILSDVAAEVRDHDGQPTTYLSPSMVQRRDGSGGGEGKKKKKKKKKKAKGAAEKGAAAAADAGSASASEDEEEADSSAQVALATSAAATPKSASAAPAPDASSAASIAASASAPAPAATAAAPSSAPAFPVISPVSPYVFNAASKVAADAHVSRVAQACVGSIPVLLQKKLTPFAQLTPYVQGQITKPLLEYARSVGAETAARIAVKFN